MSAPITGIYQERRKIVRAIQIRPETFNDAASWLRQSGLECTTTLWHKEHFWQSSILVLFPEGTVAAYPGDWIVLDNDEQFSVMQDLEFAATYEAVS